jgi:hypothetical protein
MTALAVSLVPEIARGRRRRGRRGAGRFCGCEPPRAARRGAGLVLGSRCVPFSDLSGGFKLWRADGLGAIDRDELLSAGYAFQVETTRVAHLAGAWIEDLPFVFSERIAGGSKMTFRISLEGHPRDARPPPAAAPRAAAGVVASVTTRP